MFQFPVYRQASGSDDDDVAERINRSRLLKLFKENVSATLLGTESFWEGIDVPGQALSCVVIDKLPFPVPNDPVIVAREKRGERTFMTYSIPRMIIALRQGFGRLIRRKTDRGVVVIADRRLFSKWYGQVVFENLPKSWDSREVSYIAEFLK
jgi:ATP-dependent DNA helicase DinG